MLAERARAETEPWARPSPDRGVPRRVRLAVFSYSLPRAGMKRGGIERVAHDLADGLARRGHAVTVYSHDPRPPGAAYETASLPWRGFVSTWAGRRLTMGYLGNVLMLVTRVGDAEILMAHGDSLLLPLRGRPVVRVMHGSALDEARTATSIGRRCLQAGVYGLELLTAALQRHCVAVSANTQRANRFIRHVIPNGVNRRVFRPDPAQRSPRPSILFVGTLGGRKRGGWLLRQFHDRVRSRCPDAELHMVCEGAPPGPGVVVHAGITDVDLAVLYRRAWVFASPSTYEGFGLPYLEAMASGTPVVATPNPGSLEILDGGAYGCLAGDEAFADRLCDLLGDADERARLIAAGLRRAEQLDLDRTLDAYEALFASMVGSRG